MHTQSIIWTIGYGGRPPLEFVRQLQLAGVQLVADIRYSPRGAMGSYTKAKTAERGIEKLLSDGGIGYAWLPELGNPDRADPSMEQFFSAIVPELPLRTKRLVELAAIQNVCVLCACRQAATCHRAFVGAWMSSKNWQVIDL